MTSVRLGHRCGNDFGNVSKKIAEKNMKGAAGEGDAQNAFRREERQRPDQSVPSFKKRGC